MKNKIMKTIIATFLACSFILLQIGNGYAQGVAVTKTFEYGHKLEYDLVATVSNQQFKIRCTINKNTDSAHIRYGGENRTSKFSTLQPILVKLLVKADTLVKGNIHSMTAFEFLNCDDIGKAGVLAFQNHEKWQNYLAESKRRYIRPPNDFVKDTLIKKNVYKDLHEAVRLAGFKLELVSIEKVFTFKAEQLSFYADLKTMGIAADTIFPVPGILGFRLTQRK